MGTRSMFIALTGATLLLGIALPAPASATSVSNVTITITGGVLSITTPSATVPLATMPNSVAGGPVSTSLGEVQVNDARSAVAGSGWVASVIATAFTPTGGTAIAASAIGYTTGAITKVGTATYVATNQPDLTAVHTVVTATGITGDNSATWFPTINVAVPGAVLAGTYTATITHSVV